MTPAQAELRDRRHWRQDLAADVREDHGGIDAPASFVGALVAISMLGLLAALAGAFVDQVNLDAFSGDEQAYAGVAVGALVVLLAFFAGGWTAARSARYSGVANSVMTVVWTLVIAAAFSALGWLLASDTPLLDGQLPNFLTGDDFDQDAALSAVAGLVVMLVGAVMGGIKGQSYHRKLDRELLAEPEDMERLEVEDDDDERVDDDRAEVEQVHLEPIRDPQAVEVHRDPQVVETRRDPEVVDVRRDPGHDV